MLSRLHGSLLAGRRLNIPRRGRIRGVLVLVAAALIVYMVSGKGLSLSKNQLTKEPHSSKKNMSLFNRALRAPNSDIVLKEDVAALFKVCPPRLQQLTDTFHLENRSLVVHFSIDSTLQKAATELLRRYHPRYGGIVAIEPQSGRILAFVSYVGDDAPSRQSNICIQSLFPAASVIKMVTASGAIEKARLTGQSMLPIVGRRHTLYRFQITEHLRSADEISFEDAYAYSVNPVFGRLGVHLLGSTGLQEYIDKYGFNVAIPFDLDNDPACASVTDSAYDLAELASGFTPKTKMSPLYGSMLAATVSEDGRMPSPSLVDSINDLRSNRRIYRAAPEVWRTPIQSATAAQLRELMGTVTEYGTASRSFRDFKRSSISDNVEYGGKTGSLTADSLGKVDWFVGFANSSTYQNQRIALGIVTVHGKFWTVHSSYLGAELMRVYLKDCKDNLVTLRLPTTVAKRPAYDNKG